MKNKLSIAMTLAVVLAMLVTSLALADQVNPDGDVLTSGNQTSIALGDVAPGAVITRAVSFTLVCNGNNHVNDGQTLNLAFSLANSTVAAGGGLNATGASVGPIPTSWPEDGNGCGSSAPAPRNDNGDSTVTITAPNSPGNHIYVVTYSKDIAPPDVTGQLFSVTFTLTVVAPSDMTAPDTIIDSGPSSLTNSNNASFTFHSTEAGSSFACSLDGGAFSACTSAQSYSGLSDGSHSFAVRATDAANNTDPTPATYSWTVDTTAPSVTVAPDRGPDLNGWYNHSVDFTTSGTDASGIASCTPVQTYSGPDGSSFTVNGSCTDNAGNTSSSVASSAFNYDATAPTVTVTPDRSADQNGWYNHSVDFTTAGTDDTSDIASCTPVQTYSAPDGSGLTVSGSCTDNAGNTGNGASDAFDYDATAPHDVTVAADRGPDSNGWYNHAFTATWSGADDTSGIDSCTNSNYSGPDTNAGSLSGTCTDNAGNTSGSVDFNFMYDATKPTISAAVSAGTLGLNGWYMSDVTVHFTCADNLSGVVSCPADQTLSTEGTGISSSAQTVTDVAGNTNDASNVVSVNIDKTAPSITITTPPNGASYLLNQPVAANYSCADATSGIATCAGPVLNGSNIDTTGTGPKSFTVNATDLAGNSNSANNDYSVAFKICVLYDQTKAHKSGSTVPLKLQLCDFNGVNYSSAAIVVRAISVTKLDNTAGALDDSGAANSPDMNFRYDATLGGSGGYIFNLSTKGLTTGTWKVTFTINGASNTSYFVKFDVK